MAMRLRDQLNDTIALHQYSHGTGRTYWKWIKEFVLFHGKKHPREMGAVEIEDYLTYLSTTRRVSAFTQNQALAALLFLYQNDCRRLDAGDHPQLPVALPARLV